MILAGVRTWLQSKRLGDKQEFDSPSEASTFLLLCRFFLFYLSFLLSCILFSVLLFHLSFIVSLRSLLLFFLSVSFFSSFWFLLVLFLPSCLLLGCDPHFPSAPLPFVSILVLPVGAVGPRCL